MTRLFDMELFLSGVVTGSHETRQRHLRQARVIQAIIYQKWGKNNPWSWRLKHLTWFLEYYLVTKSAHTRYRYQLTAILISSRLGKTEDWKLDTKVK
nr:hypothetical protein [Pseudomonas viridiflava]